jgi:hypothetical protein
MGTSFRPARAASQTLIKKARVFGVAFSPDGSLLATAGFNESV